MLCSLEILVKSVTNAICIIMLDRSLEVQFIPLAQGLSTTSNHAAQLLLQIDLVWTHEKQDQANTHTFKLLCCLRRITCNKKTQINIKRDSMSVRPPLHKRLLGSKLADNSSQSRTTLPAPLPLSLTVKWHCQCCHFWCFNITYLMLWDKFLMSDVLATDLMLTVLIFVFHVSCPFRWKEVRLIIIIKFLSSIFHPHLCLVIIPNRSCFDALRIAFYVTHDWLLHLITILRFSRIQWGSSLSVKYC